MTLTFECIFCDKHFDQEYYRNNHARQCPDRKARVCSICRQPGCGGRSDHRLIGFRSER